MCTRVVAIVFIGLALLIALLATVLPQNWLVGIIYISRFFDIMLPILAVGALIKYLCVHKHCHDDVAHHHHHQPEVVGNRNVNL